MIHILCSPFSWRRRETLPRFNEYKMEDKNKTQKQLIRELTTLRQRIAELEATGRKRVEDTSRETSLFLKSILDSSSSISIVFTDLEQNILFWNKGAENIFGYKAEEVVDRHTVDILYPDEGDTKQIVKEIRSYILNKKRGLRREIKEITKDGRILWISLTSTPRFDENGNVIGILGIGEDITERKNVEDALRESEERFRKVVETMKVGLAACDENGILTYVNEFSSSMIGYSVDEMIGHDPTDFYYDEEERKAQKEIFENRRKGMRDAPTHEVAWRTKDGHKVYSILSPTPMFDEEGRYKGSFAIHTDITERKQAEEDLQHSYQQIQDLLITMVNALASTVEMKDQYTAGHQSRVAQLACAIAEEMGLPAEQIDGIRVASLIHDIGKIMVPAEILNKPGPLTEIQYEMIKMHPEAGYDILKDIKFPWPVAQIILQHHERMNGSGYPQGLSGEAILLEARILAVANIIEAMVSHRPYRAALTIKEALAEISKNKGTLYDPAVVTACKKLFSKKRFAFDERSKK